ncbi:dihydroorotase [Desulfofundulus thermosubterraneus]|uniref:Dihydroorotase n=1 Tax=Desulfofundulus thermosubterraneus DSM 16057 TaxID=1121432 RepID=A0A1M6BSX6_9FIRM|nr:dihydroorotase [Desulfofundulus thermosubterraneus]SHI51836.1 dihydroorotase [Desulfofundulus thermosubterraneus DSM 16057]
MHKLLLKGGRVVDPQAGEIFAADILIVDGRITAIGPGLEPGEGAVMDVAGKLVAPGLIDMHVHFREPGFEAKETIASGSRAAARGGFTAVACMPNTNPVADNRAVITYIKTRAEEAGLVKVYPIAALTRGSRGEELTEMADLKEAGAVALSDDGHPVASAAVMRRAMQYARMVGLPVISHCEEPTLSAGGVMHEGYMSTVLGLPGIPAAAEEIMVARDIILSEYTGCPLHIAHVSTSGSVRLIREAKARGVPVTAEVTPHHFTLTDRAVADYNTSTKVNPPLRTEEDVAALKEALADGTIDVIATDHAPHTLEEKDVEYQLAPFGLVGLETALGLVWTELVVPGVLSPVEAIRKLTVNPARILGLQEGVLKVGADADITIIDPELMEVVDPATFASKGRNTPFSGRRLQGLPVATIVKGRVVYNRDLAVIA